MPCEPLEGELTRGADTAGWVVRASRAPATGVAGAGRVAAVAGVAATNSTGVSAQQTQAVAAAQEIATEVPNTRPLIKCCP
jgi:hypothetical protein